MVEASKPVNLGQLSAELGPALPDAPGGQGTQAVQVAALRAQVVALTATVRALAAAVDALDDEEQTRADALAAIADRLG